MRFARNFVAQSFPLGAPFIRWYQLRFGGLSLS
jgi:hypothetical protein